MGVMSCSRRGCENIMCDIHVPFIGYICYDCKKEFSEKNQDLEIEGEIIQELKKFMDTRKEEYSNAKKSMDQFFDEHTK